MFLLVENGKLVPAVDSDDESVHVPKQPGMLLWTLLLNLRGL